MHPIAFPSGKVIEEKDTLWAAGFRNGLPSIVDAEFPEHEYTKTRSFAAVLHMYNPSELPPFLEPGQSLVIHLPPLPSEVYTLHVFTTGDELTSKKITDFPHRQLARERNLCIRWNDHRIWQRFHSPYADHIRVLLDPTLMNPNGNLISLENRGQKSIPLDALSIRSLQPGSTPFYVALEDVEWLPSDQNPWVRTVLLHVPAPFISNTPEPALNFPIRNPPQNITDVQAAWPLVEARYRELEAANHPQVKILGQWIPPLRDAISRGMVPVVKLEGKSQYLRNLDAAAFLFGDVIGGWQLRIHDDRFGVRARLQTTIKQPIFLDGRSEETPQLPWPASIESGYWHLLLPHLGYRFRKYFNGDFSLEHIHRLQNRSYTLYPDYDKQFMPNKQGSEGEWLFRNTIELLSTTHWPVTLSRGFPCSPYFPDGTGRPASLWYYVRPLFRFGGISSRETLANIVPEQSGTLLNSAFWTVADNGKDRVEVLASLPYAEAQQATLELPVPWSGPTWILHHSVSPKWNTTAPPGVKTTVRVVEAEKLSATITGPFKGWIREPFSIDRLHLFELRPADAPPEQVRRIELPWGEPRVPELHSLFQVSETPPPAWWSRVRLNRTRGWAWRTSGPVDLDSQAPTRPGRLPDWQPLTGFHQPIPSKIDGATPLSDTSTTFQFLKNPEQIPQVIRMEMEFNILHRTEAVGMWVRAHPSAGHQPSPKGFHNRPRTRFWVGNREGRQLIEIPYGAWCFLGGGAKFWRTERPTGEPVQRKGVLFWPDETLDHQPIIEINSFDAYQLSLERGLDSPDKTLGFVHERADGTLALLIVGKPGKGAYWRQRLDRYIDATSFVHVEDETLRISAPTPEDPPPEKVPFQITGEPNAKLFEINIPKMPPASSEWYLQKIAKDFPLIGPSVNNPALSAVLLQEDQQSVGK